MKLLRKELLEVYSCQNPGLEKVVETMKEEEDSLEIDGIGAIQEKDQAMVVTPERMNANAPVEANPETDMKAIQVEEI